MEAIVNTKRINYLHGSSGQGKSGKVGENSEGQGKSGNV